MKIYTDTITGDETVIRDEVHGALIEFYHAFNHQNLEAMQKNWSKHSSIVMSNPLGGVKRDWSEIGEVYSRIFYGNARVYVEFYDYTVIKTGDMFCVAGRERGYFKDREVTIALDIRTSRIYTKENGEWKQVHHHGSITDVVVLEKYQQVVLGTH